MTAPLTKLIVIHKSVNKFKIAYIFIQKIKIYIKNIFAKYYNAANVSQIILFIFVGTEYPNRSPFSINISELLIMRFIWYLEIKRQSHAAIQNGNWKPTQDFRMLSKLAVSNNPTSFEMH